VTEVIIHTGQHYDDDMSAVFFRDLGIPEPDVNLAVGSQAHGAQTGQMLAGIEAELMRRRPDWVIVYGDTNSTLAGALAAAKLGIRVGHVEAGLRSFNRAMPEELNRIVADHTSDLLFAPTVAAERHLAREGLPATRIHNVGDVMIDSIRLIADRSLVGEPLLARLGLHEGSYVVATVHRAENTDDVNRLRVIVEALVRLAQTLPVVLPAHPRTRAALIKHDLYDRLREAVMVVPPLGYLEMVHLTRGARLVATDSGGLQKEAFALGVPCVTVRNETEWVELVELGWNRLAPPTEVDSLYQTLLQALDTRGQPGEPYGDGRAADKISQILQANP
jgi:UDP-GlcNAc3NAcA epimerase